MTATLTQKESKTGTTITIARSALRTALTKLAGAVDTSTKALPATQHVRLEVAEGRLTLAATDFEAFVRVRLSCDHTAPAVTLLPAKRLAEIVGALPPVSAITLTLTRSLAVLTAGRARFEMATMDPEEFPVFPVVATDRAPITVPVAPFLDAIARAVAHASVEHSRASLNVVRLEPHASADGATRHALLVTGLHGQHMARLTCPIADGALGEGCSLHRTSVPVLTRLFSGLADDATLTLSADEHRAQLDTADAMALVRLVDLQFPDYSSAIRGVTASRTVTCDRVVLSAAVRRVALSSGPARRIELTVGAREIAVTAAEAGLGTAADVVPVDGATGETTPMTIPMNAGFTLTALETIAAPSVTLTIDAVTKPILFRADGQDAADPSMVLVQPLAR